MTSFPLPSTSAVSDTQIRTELQKRLPPVLETPHPRLFLTDADTVRIRGILERDELARKYYSVLKSAALDLMAMPEVPRNLVGKRMLAASREVLRRVTLLGLVYRLEGGWNVRDRLDRELRSAAAYSDWNPSHYLDTAEMTLALALGYDWLYGDLSAATRDEIYSALLKNGFGTYERVGVKNNWNDVCNGSFIIASLALESGEQDLARDTLARALRLLPVSFSEYSDNGTHPEGPGSYWSYATYFSVPALAVLEQTLHTDFGLPEAYPGFLNGGDYYQHMLGPSGLSFNYSDASPSGSIGPQPQLFWMADRANRPEWIRTVIRAVREKVAEPEPRVGRMEAFGLIWWPAERGDDVPERLYYQSDGGNEVAAHRSSWTDADAVWIGFKGGSPLASHGHMDIGSFVFESDGVRWALDLGMQDYHSLESIGLNLGNRSQDSERWTVFRLNTFSHNTLLVNGRNQRFDGVARITGTDPNWTRMDLTDLYPDLARAERGVWRHPDRTVWVQDEVSACDADAEIRWAMLTDAEVETRGRTARLRKWGKTLTLELEGAGEAQFEIIPSDPPPHEFDVGNPGTRMIGFRFKVPAGTPDTVRVRLIPGSAEGTEVPERLPLADW